MTMCKFCERAGITVKSISVNKFAETKEVMDGFFGCVKVGTQTLKKQPTVTLKTNKGTYTIPMPVEFSYCPHCGRKI